MTKAIEITVMSGPYDGETHILQSPRDPTIGFVLGRHASCDLSFSYDDWVSGQHARLFSHDGLWYMEDMASTNKTHLGTKRANGTFSGRVRADGIHPLINDQLIQLGRLWIRVNFVDIT